MIAGGSCKTWILFVSVGGTNGHDFFSDVHRFNFREGTWTKCHVTGFNRGPEARYRHELAYWQSKVVNRTLQTHKEDMTRYFYFCRYLCLAGVHRWKCLASPGICSLTPFTCFKTPKWPQIKWYTRKGPISWHSSHYPFTWCVSFCCEW